MQRPPKPPNFCTPKVGKMGLTLKMPFIELRNLKVSKLESKRDEKSDF